MSDLVWVTSNANRKSGTSPSPRPARAPRPEAFLTAQENAQRRKAETSRAKVDMAHIAAWQEHLNGPLSGRRQPGEPVTPPPPRERTPTPADVAALYLRARQQS